MPTPYLLELCQGEGSFQNSNDLLSTITSCQTDCVSHGSKDNVVPGVGHREGEHVQCHKVHVCEVSGRELDSGHTESLAQAKCAHVHKDSSSDLSPRVKGQTDSSLLTKSQQRVEEMLSQLESETVSKQWDEISPVYSKRSDT